MGTSCSWIFQFPHKISEGENIEKTNYENIKKIKRLKVKLEILKIKIERKKKIHQGHHLFQLRLLENGSFMPPTIQVSFAISDEIW